MQGARWLVLLAIIFPSNQVVPKSSTLVVNSSGPKIKLNERFVSIAINPAELLRENLIRHDSNYTLNLLHGLAPAYIRFDSPNIDDGNHASNIIKSPESYWRTFKKIIRLAGLDIIACTELPERNGGDMKWDMEFLKLASQMARQHIDPIYQFGCDGNVGFELGNELKRVRKLLQTSHRLQNTKLVGPDITSIDKEDVAEHILDYIVTAYPAFDALAWKPRWPKSIMVQQSSDALENFSLPPDYLTWDRQRLQKIFDRTLIGKPLWISEPREKNSGSFADALIFARRLVLAARNGVDIVMMRPDFNSPTRPEPKYWVALLHKQLLGQVVLNSQQTNHSDVSMIAQCMKTQNSERAGLGVFVVNTGPNDQLIDLQGLLDDNYGQMTYNQYILHSGPDAKAIFSRDIYLNNDPLQMGEKGQLPYLKPIKKQFSAGISQPPFSVGFWIFPQAEVDQCQDSLVSDEPNEIEIAGANVLLKESSDDTGIHGGSDYSGIHKRIHRRVTRQIAVDALGKSLKNNIEAFGQMINSKMQDLGNHGKKFAENENKLANVAKRFQSIQGTDQGEEFAKYLEKSGLQQLRKIMPTKSLIRRKRWPDVLSDSSKRIVRKRRMVENSIPRMNSEKQIKNIQKISSQFYEDLLLKEIIILEQAEDILSDAIKSYREKQDFTDQTIKEELANLRKAKMTDLLRIKSNTSVGGISFPKEKSKGTEREVSDTGSKESGRTVTKREVTEQEDSNSGGYKVNEESGIPIKGNTKPDTKLSLRDRAKTFVERIRKRIQEAELRAARVATVSKEKSENNDPSVDLRKESNNETIGRDERDIGNKRKLEAVVNADKGQVSSSDDRKPDRDRKVTSFMVRDADRVRATLHGPSANISVSISKTIPIKESIVPTANKASLQAARLGDTLAAFSIVKNVPTPPNVTKRNVRETSDATDVTSTPHESDSHTNPDDIVPSHNSSIMEDESTNRSDTSKIDINKEILDTKQSINLTSNDVGNFEPKKVISEDHTKEIELIDDAADSQTAPIILSSEPKNHILLDDLLKSGSPQNFDKKGNEPESIKNDLSEFDLITHTSHNPENGEKLPTAVLDSYQKQVEEPVKSIISPGTSKEIEMPLEPTDSKSEQRNNSSEQDSATHILFDPDDQKKFPDSNQQDVVLSTKNNTNTATLKEIEMLQTLDSSNFDKKSNSSEQDSSTDVFPYPDDQEKFPDSYPQEVELSTKNNTNTATSKEIEMLHELDSSNFDKNSNLSEQDSTTDIFPYPDDQEKFRIQASSSGSYQQDVQESEKNNIGTVSSKKMQIPHNALQEARILFKKIHQFSNTNEEEIHNFSSNESSTREAAKTEPLSARKKRSRRSLDVGDTAGEVSNYLTNNITSDDNTTRSNVTSYEEHSEDLMEQAEMAIENALIDMAPELYTEANNVSESNDSGSCLDDLARVSERLEEIDDILKEIEDLGCLLSKEDADEQNIQKLAKTKRSIAEMKDKINIFTIKRLPKLLNKNPVDIRESEYNPMIETFSPAAAHTKYFDESDRSKNKGILSDKVENDTEPLALSRNGSTANLSENVTEIGQSEPVTDIPDKMEVTEKDQEQDSAKTEEPIDSSEQNAQSVRSEPETQTLPDSQMLKSFRNSLVDGNLAQNKPEEHENEKTEKHDEIKNHGFDSEPSTPWLQSTNSIIHEIMLNLVKRKGAENEKDNESEREITQKSDPVIRNSMTTFKREVRGMPIKQYDDPNSKSLRELRPGVYVVPTSEMTNVHAEKAPSDTPCAQGVKPLANVLTLNIYYDKKPQNCESQKLQEAVGNSVASKPPCYKYTPWEAAQQKSPPVNYMPAVTHAESLAPAVPSLLQSPHSSIASHYSPAHQGRKPNDFRYNPEVLTTSLNSQNSDMYHQQALGGFYDERYQVSHDHNDVPDPVYAKYGRPKQSPARIIPVTNFETWEPQKHNELTSSNVALHGGLSRAHETDHDQSGWYIAKGAEQSLLHTRKDSQDDMKKSHSISSYDKKRSIEPYWNRTLKEIFEDTADDPFWKFLQVPNNLNKFQNGITHDKSAPNASETDRSKRSIVNELHRHRSKRSIPYMANEVNNFVRNFDTRPFDKVWIIPDDSQKTEPNQKRLLSNAIVKEVKHRLPLENDKVLHGILQRVHHDDELLNNKNVKYETYHVDLPLSEELIPEPPVSSTVYIVHDSTPVPDEPSDYPLLKLYEIISDLFKIFST